MKKTFRPSFALAAVFPAVMVPILLPVLQTAGLSDLPKGLAAGVLIGVSIVLITLAGKPRHAGDSCPTPNSDIPVS